MAKTNKQPMIGVVIPRYLNVRETPSGKIKDVVKCGAQLDVQKVKGGWAQIKVGELAGWVMLEYLDVKEARS